MKRKQKKKRNSTRELINTKTISDYSLKLFNNDEIIFFVIQPQNLSVMSKESIASKIFSLTNVIKGLSDLELICLNSRDNFENNKMFLRKRIDEEKDETIVKLLKQDLYHLDKIQTQTATARLSSCLLFELNPMIRLKFNHSSIGLKSLLNCRILLSQGQIRK